MLASRFPAFRPQLPPYWNFKPSTRTQLSNVRVICTAAQVEGGGGGRGRGCKKERHPSFKFLDFLKVHEPNDET